MEGKLKIDIRRNRILEILKRDGRVQVKELCQTLGVTPVTIRTDLDTLEKDGYVERVSGGAIYLGDNPSVHRDNIPNITEKLEIAEKIAAMISDGDTQLIDTQADQQRGHHDRFRDLPANADINIVGFGGLDSMFYQLQYCRM